jgi:hypothetical protein
MKDAQRALGRCSAHREWSVDYSAHGIEGDRKKRLAKSGSCKEPLCLPVVARLQLKHATKEGRHSAGRYRRGAADVKLQEAEPVPGRRSPIPLNERLR